MRTTSPIRNGFWGKAGFLTILLSLFPSLVLAGGPLSNLYFPKGRPDTVMYLYGPDNRVDVVASNDDLYPGSLLSGITALLDAKSNYYIRVGVTDNADRDDSGYYHISISGPGSSSIVRVPADTTELTVNGGSYRGSLENETDENLYIFRTAGAGKYTISLQFDLSQIEPGIPRRWKTNPVIFNLDRGPLGDLEEDTIVRLVRNSIALWNDLPSSSFRCEEGPRLSTDVERSTLETAPNSRHGAKMFFDPVRGTLLLFGGYDGYQTYGDQWEWNGEKWNKLIVEPMPVNRESYALALDSKKNRIVLFGGYGETELLNDTWTWDGVSWNEISTNSQPSSRLISSMAYDEKRGEMVLFGGADFSQFYGDTWIWNGDKWTQKKPSTSPTARAGHSLFYDPTLQKVILYGGYSGSGSFQDMWSWDGVKWSKLSISKTPGQRDSYALAVNRKQSVALLFGGMDGDGNFLNDTWIWNGASWTEFASATAPSPRQESALAYDPNRDEIVLCGGEGGTDKENAESLGETWILRSQEWKLAMEEPLTGYEFLDQLHTQGINPILFDDTGDLIELFLGEGSKEVSIGVSSVGTKQDSIIEGQIILNGWFASEEAEDSHKSLNQIGQTILHEFGHFLGIDHAQFYSHMIADSLGANDSYTACMYPYSGPSDDSPPPYLHYDDKVSASAIYLSEDNAWQRNYGAISGKALFSDGQPVLGGIVIARLVSDRLRTVVSRPVDEWAAFTGEFRIPGLPPGRYEVWMEAADPRSYGSSDVGYHAEYEKGPAFEKPPRPEFYNGRGENTESQSDNPSFLTLVDVAAGQDTKIEFLCEPLSFLKERMAQILAFGSPMMGGFSAQKRAFQHRPFSVVVTDGIQDLTLSLTPYNHQPLCVRVDCGDRVAYGLNGPEAREDGCLIYDRKRQQILLFGGQSESSAINDLWQWNGTAWTLVPVTGGPKPRSEFAMAYDENQDSVVLFGGTDENYEILGDTWVWDGNQWNEMTPGDTPSARRVACMAYNSIRKKVVLFGGIKDDGTYMNDLWEWDGLSWTPIRVTGAPSPRAFGALAFDRDRGKMVLFGGSDEKNPLNDTWEWDGSRWTQIQTAQAPDPRAGQSMIYDEVRKKIYLFGGRTEEGRQNDLWEFANGQWTPLPLTVLPPARSATLQAAYDSNRGKLVVFSGLSVDDWYLRDIWEFDGEQWRNASPSPENQDNPSITFRRAGENGPKLETGTYFIYCGAASDISGEYSIVATSTSVENITPIGHWELY